MTGRFGAILRGLTARLMSLRLVVVCLSLLMVLTFWGTLYQIEHGLWAAQQRFFTSWVFLVGGVVPFPGAQAVLAVLFVSLSLSMLYRFSLGWRQAGLVTIHLGLMLMLAGGWVTHQFGEDSFLTLVEGEGSNLASSYRDWEVALWTEPGPNRTVVAFDADRLEPGTEFAAEEHGLAFAVQAYHPHCRAFAAPDAPPDPLPLNASGIHRLQPEPVHAKPEEDIPGLLATVTPAGGNARDLILFGGESAPTVLEVDGMEVKMQLRRRRLPLPVFVQLTDFKKEFYPNTQTPKSFASWITVHLGEMQRDVVVEMNQPFRFQEFTFYQASYGNLESGAELSTFAVTRNVGRLLPYLATAMTVLGLLVHFVMEISARARMRSTV